MNTTAPTQHLEIPRPDGSAGRIAYDDQGTGPVVLLAPGMGDVRATFRFLTPLLLAAGYRVVTTDYRGLGESDTGFDEYSSAATGGDLAALIRHLDAGPVLLYGNSYTAASAVHVLADSPELLRGTVLAGPFVRDAPATLVGRIGTFLITRPLLTAPVWFAWWPKMFPQRPADYAEYLAAVRANLKEPGRTKVYARMCAAGHGPAEAELPRAKASGVPVLVAMGTADADFPDAAAEAEWVGEQLGAAVEMVEGSGHHPQVDAPEQIRDLILAFDRAAFVAASHSAEK
ncbi:alpha/beta fold hydrolase [Streptacidiphilus carbonis]|jgi:pimeloyl-ACP methyl ester carboxylesterase|uniref:alpha/beta fold hydrolase n=1 Tax=Streptacidiphilus carbonis TaxID=105422 RepID=UPI0005AB521C|nr:alpha/beta hydrolase [Streptacidiphilus carbonis]